MSRTWLLAAVILAGIMAASAVVWAQDFFGRRRRGVEIHGNVDYDDKLTFVRIQFTTPMGCFRRRGSNGEPPWAHDYPTADTHLMKILEELTLASPRTDGSNVFSLDDPELFNYPVAYLSEPGCWVPEEEEVAGLRNYLLKGGFIIFDDFQGYDMDNLREQMRRVLPYGQWVELDSTHPIFNAFFEIKNTQLGWYGYGRETYYGIFEDNDPNQRLLAIAGHNQDLGEYWEFSATGMVPIDLSNEAYKFGVNYFIYGLTH